MPVIVIQHAPPDPPEGNRFPLQIATNGYMIADAGDTEKPLAIATDGYLQTS